MHTTGGGWSPAVRLWSLAVAFQMDTEPDIRYMQLVHEQHYTDQQGHNNNAVEHWFSLLS